MNTFIATIILIFLLLYIFIKMDIFLFTIISIFFIPLYRAIRYPDLRRDYLIIWSFSFIWYPSAWAYITSSIHEMLDGFLILWMMLELVIMLIYFPIVYFVIKINNKSLRLVSFYWMIGNFFWLFCMLFFLGLIGAGVSV